MLIFPDLMLTAVAYIATAIATLRAGSRILYLLGHDGQIDIMDGPLIIGPSTYNTIPSSSTDFEEKISVTSRYRPSMQEVERKPEDVTSSVVCDQISPLWEYTDAFQKAVLLSAEPSMFRFLVLDDGKGLYEDYSNEKLEKVWFPQQTILDSSTKYDLTRRGIQLALLNQVLKHNYELKGNQHSGYRDDSRGMTKQNEISHRDAIIRDSNDSPIQQNKKYRHNVTPGSFKSILYSRSYRWIHSVQSALELLILTQWSTFATQILPTISVRNMARSRMTSGRSDTPQKLECMEWDYKKQLYSVINGSDYMLRENATGSHNNLVVLKSFAPNTFADLRTRFRITQDDFMRSIFQSGPFVSFQSNSKGAARSGGFFFYTRDGKFMIKTIKKAEIQSLLRMLPKYHQFMIHNSKRSMLTRFCGLYSVQFISQKNQKLSIPDHMTPGATENEVFFLVMNSVFPVGGNKFITERYDLKGSTVGRACTMKELVNRNNVVLKDLDLIHGSYCNQSSYCNLCRGYCKSIHLGERTKAAFLSQLTKDVSILKEGCVMDYSLLIGIVSFDAELSRSKLLVTLPKKSSIHEGLRLSKIAFEMVAAPIVYLGIKLHSITEKMMSSFITIPYPYYGAEQCGVNGGRLGKIEGQRNGHRAIFYIGLIDFLQPWTLRKYFERELKGLCGYDKKAISCVDPSLYATRFLDFIDAHIS